jgi:hypothetical protein
LKYHEASHLQLNIWPNVLLYTSFCLVSASSNDVGRLFSNYFCYFFPNLFEHYAVKIDCTSLVLHEASSCAENRWIRDFEFNFLPNQITQYESPIFLNPINSTDLFHMALCSHRSSASISFDISPNYISTISDTEYPFTLNSTCSKPNRQNPPPEPLAKTQTPHIN